MDPFSPAHVTSNNLPGPKHRRLNNSCRDGLCPVTLGSLLVSITGEGSQIENDKQLRESALFAQSPDDATSLCSPSTQREVQTKNVSYLLPGSQAGHMTIDVWCLYTGCRLKPCWSCCCSVYTFWKHKGTLMSYCTKIELLQHNKN